jgi:hypothetical protein
MKSDKEPTIENRIYSCNLAAQVREVKVRHGRDA